MGGTGSVITTIARNDLKISLRERSVVLWTFLMPVVFMFVFGMAFRNIFPSNVRAQLTLDNRDDGFISRALVEQIARENIKIVLIDTLRSNPVRTLVIPRGFTRDVLSRRRTVLKLVRDENANAGGTQVVHVALMRSLMKVVGSGIVIELNEVLRGDGMLKFEGDTLSGSLYQEVKGGRMSITDLSARFDSLLSREGRVRLREEYAGRAAMVPSGFDNSVPGTLVMFVLMTMAFTGELLVYEKITGIIRRYGYSSATRVEILSGKLLGRMLLAAIQMLFLLLVGRFIFGVHVSGDVYALIVVLLLFAFSMGAYGLAFGTIFRQREQISSIAIISTLALSALGGCWWPIEIVPRPFQILSYMLPTGWIMDALHKIISFGYGFQEVTWNMAVMALSGVLFLWFAEKKFRF